MTAAGRPWWRGLALLLRLALAAVWLVAAAHKVVDLPQSVRAVRAFRLLPGWAVPTVGHVLPFVEAAVGLALLTGFRVRAAAWFSALLDVAYVVGIAAASARHLRIDCGCFTRGGDLAPGEPTRYAADLVRDAATLAFTLLLAWRPVAAAAGRTLGLDGVRTARPRP